VACHSVGALLTNYLFSLWFYYFFSRYQKFVVNFKDAGEFRRCLLDDYLKVSIG